ncbi:hypothetical protein SO180_12000, partial [Bradyrhizobium sp. UFLA05-112]
AISTGSGPLLKISGSSVSAQAYGTWAPIAAEKTASGYDVAWKDSATGHFTAWSTDSNGNYTGNIVPEVTGTNVSFESLETTFQQDLNGDGTIGIPSAGATADASSATNFLLRHDEAFVFRSEIQPIGQIEATGPANIGSPDLSSGLRSIGFHFETQASSFDHGIWANHQSDPAVSHFDGSGLSHMTDVLMRSFLIH